MNNIEMNRDFIVNAVYYWFTYQTECDIYSDETNERINCLTERIDKHPCLDYTTKNNLENEIQFTINVAATEAFETGLRIGVSLLENLLSGEKPEIHIKESEKKKERYIPVFSPMPEFEKYISDMSRYLSQEDKLKLMGRIDTIIEKHREETRSIF